MRRLASVFVLCSISAALCSCSSMSNMDGGGYASNSPADYSSRIPQHISESGHRVVVVDPREHTWAAYSETGDLVKGGQASAGSDYCSDLGRPCHTSVGRFHVYSLGSPECKSTKFPMPRGGAPMPYCMFFNKDQALHGVPDSEVADANLSHGCVRMHVADAEWLRYNFVNIGTPVIVKSY
jgi:hypothetical protein